MLQNLPAELRIVKEYFGEDSDDGFSIEMERQYLTDEFILNSVLSLTERVTLLKTECDDLRNETERLKSGLAKKNYANRFFDWYRDSKTIQKQFIAISAAVIFLFGVLLITTETQVPNGTLKAEALPIIPVEPLPPLESNR